MREPESELSSSVIRCFLDAIVHPLAISDLDGIVTFVNKALLELWGYSEEEVVGGTVNRLWKSPSRADEMRELVISRTSYSDEMVPDVAANQTLVLNVECSLIHDADCPTGILWHFTRSSSQSESESSLQEMHMQMGRLNSLLKAIRDVNQIIVQEPDFGKMLNKASSSMVKARGYAGCTIALVSDDGETIREMAHSGGCRLRDEISVTTGGEGYAPDCIREAIISCEPQVIDSANECVECSFRADNQETPYCTITLPLTEHERSIGVLQVFVTERETLDEQEIDLLREVAADLSFAWSKNQAERARREGEESLRELNLELESRVEARTKELQDTNIALRERVKEQTCLYAVSQVLRDTARPILDILNDLIGPVAQGWQYPDITEVRIKHEDDVVLSDGFQETDWMLVSRTHTAQGAPVEVAVAYTEERPEEELGPFVDEELSLIDEITNQIARALSMRELDNSLREREQLLSMAIENAALGIVALGLDGDIIDVNRSFSKLTGYPKEELTAKKLWDYAYPDDVQTAKHEFDRLLEGEKRGVGFEMRYLHQNGSVVFADVNASLVRDANGHPVRLFIQVQDITERKKAKRNRQLIADSIPGGLVHLMDRDLKYVFSAGELLESLGLNNETLVGKPIFDILPPDIAESVAEQYKKVLGGQKIEFEGEYGGRVFLIRAIPVKSDDGSIDRILVLSVDITELKQAEHALRELNKTLEQRVEERTAEIRRSGELYRTTLETMPDAVVVTDLDMQIVMANQMAAEMHGYNSSDEMIGMDARTLFVPEDRERVIANNEAILKEGALRNREYGLVRKDGSTLSSRMNVSVLRDEEGVPTHFVVIARDLSELKQLQDELVRKERLAVLGQLSGGISHEIRNPLAAIKNGIYFLQMAIDSPDEDVKETLDILDKEVNNTVSIIESLLSFARPEPRTRQKVNIVKLLNKLILQLEIPPRINLQTEFDRESSILLADPVQLEHVFQNLITNAVEAIPEEGKISVSLDRVTTDELAISVSDTGTGIEEEDLGRIFEPLFTTKAKGIGLGLAITKSMVEAHDGRIEVSSEIRVGTTFTVYLPRYEEG